MTGLISTELFQKRLLRRNNSIGNFSVRHRLFSSVGAYVSELGGEKGLVIDKILIANNGVAAVKAIRSIRRWAYEMFENEKAIKFVVLATPEDMRSNAEYIRMGDVIVDVPGGSNNHNYANVTLIVELARLHGVHAVWAGWGHASENPALPNSLEKSNPPIKFIGPAGPPMQALGDKIGSTIIAQSAGVPCIGWNGSHVVADYDLKSGTLPESAYKEASIHNTSEALEAAEKIGFPIMIKASEGGGGKGIRMVQSAENVAVAYRQVCSEVPGSPIFIMKLSTKSRHLEVQLLADEYGNAVALNGRDCSVQRRHQKIIEEGPPLAAPTPIWMEMEKAAVSLAKAVGYANAGTVEYLYSEVDQKFYFLELNPRLQVEHPVTEMITKVNLPAAQLQVAMGIPLNHIPDIRELYGKNRFEKGGSTMINFDVAQRIPPVGHCIAVRITAENAVAGFKPTSGGIQELNFRSTPNVWGYFSMDSSGSIHEFADSQFGHLFANGFDREQARRNMVLALKELSIRGDISTTVDYVSKLIELDDFVDNLIDTAWLDNIIKDNVIGSDPQTTLVRERNMSHTHALIGAIVMAYDKCLSGEVEFLELVKKGQLPPQSVLSMVLNEELILNGVKYGFCCTRNGPNTITVALAGKPEIFFEANIRVLSDDGYLIDIDRESYVAYLTVKPTVATGMRLVVGGISVSFSPDYDPTCLRTDVAGKLVKRLVSDGAHVTKGQPYAEIEVMKMLMPLKVDESGILSWRANEGASLSNGDLLANLELANPENVSAVVVFEGDLDIVGKETPTPSTPSKLSRSHKLFLSAMEAFQNCMAGYEVSENTIEGAMEHLRYSINDPSLPVFEIDEKLSALSGRISATLFSDISEMIGAFKTIFDEGDESTSTLLFPAEKVDAMIVDECKSLEGTEHAAFISLTAALREVILPYTRNDVSCAPGSQRALGYFREMLRDWIAVERCFCDASSYADAVDILRKANKDDHNNALKVCRAHANLESTSKLVMRIMEAVGDAGRVSDQSLQFKKPPLFSSAGSVASLMPCLAEIGAMQGGGFCSAVARKARTIILQKSLSSISKRKDRVKYVVNKLIGKESTECDEKEVLDFIEENELLDDIFFPMLESYNEVQQIGLYELYAKQLYQTHTLTQVIRQPNKRQLTIQFTGKLRERKFLSTTAPLLSMTDLKRVVSQSKLYDSDSDSDAYLLSINQDQQIPAQTPRVGVFKLINNLKDLEDGELMDNILQSFPQYCKKQPKCEVGPTNFLNVAVLSECISDDDEITAHAAELCENILEKYYDSLEQADIRTVTFILGQERNSRQNVDAEEYPMPTIFSYRSRLGFKEDTLIRYIEPSLAYLLDPIRLAKNFSVRSLGSRHTSRGHIHLYEATPKKIPLYKDANASKSPRIFVRAFRFTKDLSELSLERLFVNALNAIDLANATHADNHIFINLVNDYEKVGIDPATLEQMLISILNRHEDRMSRLGIAEVDTRVVTSLSEDCAPIAIRMVASNPTGYFLVMNSYVEAADETNTKSIFKLIGGTKSSLTGSGDSSWEGMDVRSPYPLTRPFDAQRKAALKASDTLYCYDLPTLFEAAVEKQWSASEGKEGNIINKSLMTMYTRELVVQKKSNRAGPWTMSDYLNGELEMVQVQRKAGENDVGMVAWFMTLNTVEYPNGRQIILISNDITHKAGSFGTREDVVFKLASEYARHRLIPRLYVAANSGARIGLAEKVRNAYKVAFKNPSKPEDGFDFLYVTRDDYERLSVTNHELKAEPVTLGNEEVYKITDIIGSEPDLGVENLKGSGLIAGETSVAYNEIFTMTIVLGRTVGIGAYLVRLGQRTIQKNAESPIILTGYQALNKLMGCDVYSTNDQLGGPGIMYCNGISHLTAPDHLSAVSAAVDWLSYVPSVRGGMLPITNISKIDTIDRDIKFEPKPGVPYDPRYLIAGVSDDKDIWQSGFFDRGSFTETLAGWAKSVVVGRARLGGIPMGVIATENRTAEHIKPADPADVKASEAVIQEAGCVWFPNSAFKTAQAINDFRAEDLPLIIFANWRGFSGGKRDMFDEVLKYGSQIVDAFIEYTQPVFILIPPYAEIRGGAWVVLDSSINASVMEMYATSKTARGGVLEANGAASVKYRMKALIPTMHRLDEQLKQLDAKLKERLEEDKRIEILSAIQFREQSLLPVYEQIAVQFCDLHDTPGRMKAVGVIEKEVEWKDARTFFFWRLRRKLAEFDLRKKMVKTSNIGTRSQTLTPLKANALMKDWFLQTSGMTEELWRDDQVMLSWMAQNTKGLEENVRKMARDYVKQEIFQVMTTGGSAESIGTAGIVDGLVQACNAMEGAKSDKFKMMLKDALGF